MTASGYQDVQEEQDGSRSYGSQQQLNSNASFHGAQEL